MSLEDLNDAVYRRDFQAQDPPASSVPDPSAAPVHHDHPVEPSVHAWGDTQIAPPDPATQARMAERRLNDRKRLALGLVAVLLALLAVLGFFGRRLLLFEPAKVSFSLTGPEIVRTGEEATLTMHYTNENWIGLNDAELTIFYPESFHPVAEDGWDVALNRATKKIGVIPGGATDTASIKGTFHAYDKRTALFRAVLRSTPRGINNPTEVESHFTVLLDATALSLEVVGPPSIVLGQPLEYVIKYENKSQESLDAMRLQATYPVGFVPTNFDPRPITDENIWSLGTLAPGAHGQISIKGEIRGNAGDARRLTIQAGKQLGDGNFLTLAREEKVTRVLAPPLSVTLTMNDQASGIVSPGDELNGVILFRNNGEVGIRDIIATVNLSADFLDLSKLRLPSGVTYDSARRQAIFRASEVPELKSLEPGKQGKITFGLRVRSDIASLGIANIEVKTRVTLDSPDLPHGQNVEAFTPTSDSVMKVSSPVNLDFRGYYADTDFPNTGPLPPTIGQATTYTLHLGVESTINPLNEARLVLNLPSSVKFAGILSGEASKVRYNDRTGELSWAIGTIGRGSTGAAKLVLRVELTPPPGTAGQSINLVNNGSFTAKDSFTGETVESKLSNKTTYLPEDPGVSNQNSRVVE